MDAAAKKIQLLPECLLPDRPYHLAKVLDKRYRVPPDNVKLIEEREYRALQYMTLLADADRGLLFTRPYYDMREEPPNPNPAKEAIAKTEKKVVTKLSLKDYKDKQKKTSASPPDSGPRPPNKSSVLRKEGVDVKPERQAGTGDEARSREADVSGSDVKPPGRRDGPRDERPSKPDTKPKAEPNDTPEKTKRSQEGDSVRPTKNSWLEATTPIDDRSRTPRDETPRKKDGTSKQDKVPTKTTKPSATATATAPNGRAMSKSTLGSQSQLSSQEGRARADSANGTKPGSSTSNRNAPNKREGSAARPNVPPLLSPLHPIFGDGQSPPREKRRREVPDDDPPRASKVSKGNPGATVKRERSPSFKLPPLLSPTLPAMVEEELARAKTSASTSELSATSKKTRPEKDDEDDKRRIKASPKLRYRFKADTGRATFEVGRAQARKIRGILTSTTTRKEKSASLEPPANASARKRPAANGIEHVGDSIAVKRPRTTDAPSTSKMNAPSTPAKAGVSMSRVASNNSVTNTPGDANSFMPGDRPPTRQDAPDPARIKGLRERHMRFNNLGTKLKHKRDALLSHGGGGRVSETDHKLAIALCLESAISYMVSFRAVFESRRLENKAQDPKAWEGILVMLDMVRPDVGDGRVRPLEALYLQLKAIIMEELVKCYWSLDPASNARAVFHFERMRSSIWKWAADAAEKVDEDRMRASFGPWTSVEEAVDVGIRIIRRWATREAVHWRPEVSLQQANGA